MIARLAVLSVCPLALLAQTPLPDLNETLRRVAENQEKAVAARLSIVYTQETRTRLMRGGSKLAREEKRRYTVTPTATASEKKLDFFEGRYRKGGELLPYTDPKFRYKGLDIDGDMVENMTDDMVNDKESRDGIPRNLFPLTAKEQGHYTFQLAGVQKVNGTDAIRLTFEPKKDQDEREWAGEVLVDPVEFQPIRVVTKFASNIPWAVKVFLGVNIRQLGFTVTYRKVAEELWFPISYGTEFHLRVLFGYARTIILSLDNHDFRRTSADSSIQFEPEPKLETQPRPSESVKKP